MTDSPAGNAPGAAAPETTLALDGAAATIRLNRPERRNSFTDALMESLLDSVEAAVADPTVRVIVVTGGERCFSVGGDLDEFAAGVFAPPHLSVDQSAGVLRRHARAVELLRSADAVSIAAIGGPCAGAGLSLAAACDLRIASTSAVFRAAFIDAGLASDYGGAWSLKRLLGEARAKELFLLNSKVTAEQALEIGLVSRLVDPDRLETAATELAASLLAKAPLALSTAKRLLGTQPADFGEALDEESLAQKRCAYTADAREAAAAFVERRAPRFVGA